MAYELKMAIHWLRYGARLIRRGQEGLGSRLKSSTNGQGAEALALMLDELDER